MKNDLIGLALPTCEVMVNKQNRKLYGKNKNKIYLNNGENFQLDIFNPLQERIGISLKINGIGGDDDLLVLNPGQSFMLERYIGTNRKLKFSSYDIDITNMTEEKVKQAKKAIEKNGKLEVIFWNEKIKQPVYNNYSNSSVSIDNPLFSTPTSTLSGYSGSTGSKGLAGIAGNSFTVYEQNFLSGTFSEINARNSNNGTYSDNNFLSPGMSATEKDKSISNKIETGRIEKGDSSNQHFSQISFDIGEIFYKMKFQLLPFSIKPVKKKLYNSTAIKQIVENTQNVYKAESSVREYCKCGYRISRGKGIWKNCPMCGKKIKN